MVCNSAATYDAVYRRGYPEGRLRVLHNGIDAEEFRPPNRPPHRNPTRLICVASLRPEKGVIRLVHLLPAILSRHSVELRIVGDGVKRGEIEQAITHLGLQSAVILLGPQRLVAPFLNEADVYVSAAFVEGFGIAVAEAAASGMPAVVFAAPGGLSEVVVDGHTGFVISSSGKAAASSEIFATENGTIEGWNASLDPTQAVVAVNKSLGGAVYKGLAIGSNAASSRLSGIPVDRCLTLYFVLAGLLFGFGGVVQRIHDTFRFRGDRSREERVQGCQPEARGGSA